MFPINKISIDPVSFFPDGGHIEIRGAGRFDRYLAHYIKNKKKEYSNCYIFGSGGNTMIRQDMYGNDLLAIPLETFLGALIHFFGRESDNYSARIAIRTIEVFMEELSKINPNLMCVPFFK
jgi:hypothetical protein